MNRIDVHHHVMTANNVNYGLPDDLIWWSRDAALRMMDASGIRRAVVSPNSRPPESRKALAVMMSIRNGPLGDTRAVRTAIRKRIRRVNLETARTISGDLDRFGFFANIMLTNDDAAAEAVHALDQLAADGCFLPTDIGGRYLGDRTFDPLFTELDAREAVAFVHPMPLPGPPVPGLSPHVADFLLSTVRAATNMVVHDVPRRYPRIKFILSHGGGFIPYAIQRFVDVLVMQHPERTREEYLAAYRSFYYEIALANSATALDALLSLADPSHVLYGSDFPFVQPDRIQEGAGRLDELNLDAGVRQALDHENAQRIFPRR